MHEGTKYPCDQCDYVAKRPGDLSKHKKNIHVAESIQEWKLRQWIMVNAFPVLLDENRETKNE